MCRVNVALMVFFYVQIAAQEKLGITNSNYSSTNSIFLNPSSSVDSKTYAQLNLAGLNAFCFNNVVYLPGFSVWRLKRHRDYLPDPKISPIKFKKFLNLGAGIDGPAFVICKRNYGVGVFARVRSVIDLRGVPYSLVNALLDENSYLNLKKEDKINLRNFKASAMSWMEFGINFGVIYLQKQRRMITIGGNLKHISGINIFYANIQRFDGLYNDSLLHIDQIRGKLLYNTPAWNSGRGWGLDIGITYKKMLKAVDTYKPHSIQFNCGTINYKYKVGVSLRDAGYVQFTKGTMKSNLNTSGDYKKHVDTTGEQIAYNLRLNQVSAPVLASLPTNLSLQFDWNFENNIYLNGTIIKNLVPHSVTGVQGTNLVSICPRLELRYFEVAVPITLYKFMYPQLGFAFRMSTFTLGFDNVIPLLFMKPRTYSSGVYFNMGISLFKNTDCHVKKMKIADCPTRVLSRDKIGKKRSGWKFGKKKNR